MGISRAYSCCCICRRVGEYPPHDKNIDPLKENYYVIRYLRDKDVIATMRDAEKIMLDALDSSKVCMMMNNVPGNIIVDTFVSVGDGGKMTMVRLWLSVENGLLLTAEECCNITKALTSDVKFKSPSDFGLKKVSFRFAVRKDLVRAKWPDINEKKIFRRTRGA